MRVSEYRWGHAVNSCEELAEAKRLVESGGMNAVEADVIYSETQEVAVMGHPPMRDGDLPLTQFLDEMQALAAKWEDGSTSGSGYAPFIVKLDFKTMEAFESGHEDVRSFVQRFPLARGVFINADILEGPGGRGRLQFDAPRFLERAHALAKDLPLADQKKVVLSVGWAVAPEVQTTPAMAYTKDMVEEMLRVLEPYSEYCVTFPVCAANVRSSWPALRQLLDASRSHGLTLWCNVELSTETLAWIYGALEGAEEELAGRTFYDIRGFAAFRDRFRP